MAGTGIVGRDWDGVGCDVCGWDVYSRSVLALIEIFGGLGAWDERMGWY